MSIPPKLQIAQPWSKDSALKLLALKLGCDVEEVSFLFGHASIYSFRDEFEIPDIRL